MMEKQNNENQEMLENQNKNSLPCPLSEATMPHDSKAEALNQNRAEQSVRHDVDHNLEGINKKFPLFVINISSPNEGDPSAIQNKGENSRGRSRRRHGSRNRRNKSEQQTQWDVSYANKVDNDLDVRYRIRKILTAYCQCISDSVLKHFDQIIINSKCGMYYLGNDTHPLRECRNDCLCRHHFDQHHSHITTHTNNNESITGDLCCKQSECRKIDSQLMHCCVRERECKQKEGRMRNEHDGPLPHQYHKHSGSKRTSQGTGVTVPKMKSHFEDIADTDDGLPRHHSPWDDQEDDITVVSFARLQSQATQPGSWQSQVDDDVDERYRSSLNETDLLHDRWKEPEYNRSRRSKDSDRRQKKYYLKEKERTRESRNNVRFRANFDENAGEKKTFMEAGECIDSYMWPSEETAKANKVTVIREKAIRTININCSKRGYGNADSTVGSKGVDWIGKQKSILEEEESSRYRVRKYGLAHLNSMSVLDDTGVDILNGEHPDQCNSEQVVEEKLPFDNAPEQEVFDSIQDITKNNQGKRRRSSKMNNVEGEGSDRVRKSSRKSRNSRVGAMVNQTDKEGKDTGAKSKEGSKRKLSKKLEGLQNYQGKNDKITTTPEKTNKDGRRSKNTDILPEEQEIMENVEDNCNRQKLSSVGEEGVTESGYQDEESLRKGSACIYDDNQLVDDEIRNNINDVERLDRSEKDDRLIYEKREGEREIENAVGQSDEEDGGHKFDKSLTNVISMQNKPSDTKKEIKVSEKNLEKHKSISEHEIKLISNKLECDTVSVPIKTRSKTVEIDLNHAKTDDNVMKQGSKTKESESSMNDSELSNHGKKVFSNEEERPPTIVLTTPSMMEAEQHTILKEQSPQDVISQKEDEPEEFSDEEKKISLLKSLLKRRISRRARNIGVGVSANAIVDASNMTTNGSKYGEGRNRKKIEEEKVRMKASSSYNGEIESRNNIQQKSIKEKLKIETMQIEEESGTDSSSEAESLTETEDDVDDESAKGSQLDVGDDSTGEEEESEEEEEEELEDEEEEEEEEELCSEGSVDEYSKSEGDAAEESETESSSDNLDTLDEESEDDDKPEQTGIKKSSTSK